MPEHKQIELILNELNEIIDTIGKSGSIEKIPVIERDIILSRLRRIYEEISVTAYTDPHKQDQAEPEDTAGTAITEEATDDTLELDKDAVEFEAGETAEEIHEQPDEEIAGDAPEIHTDLQEEAPTKETAASEVEQPEEIVLEEPAKDQEAEEADQGAGDKQAAGGNHPHPGIIAEKLTGNKQIVYETLAEKSSRDSVSTKLQSTPISNISAAIGVNDKFRLIRDLFNGDSTSFNKTLETLNGATNFNEAFTYINENFAWDMEDPSVQLILDLVRRKFIVKKDE